MNSEGPDKLMKFFNYAFAVIISITVTGCANQAINPTKLEGIERVFVITETASVKLDYQGPATAWGPAIGGALGGLLASQDYVSETEAMNVFLEEQNIELIQQAYNHLMDDLKQSQRFQYVEHYEDSDARLFLDSVTFSFLTSNPLTTNVMPTIGISASLVRNGGGTIWEGESATTIYTISTEEGRNLPEWLQEPEFTSDVINQSIGIAVQELATDFNEAVAFAR